MTCTVSSVTAFNTTAIVATGYTYFTWTAVPTVIALSAAATLRDQRVATLTTNVGAVLGTTFPNAVPNCACYGLDLVTASVNDNYIYNVNVGGVGMQCGARLTYNPALVSQITNQIGVDDGTTNPGNLGKFCSAIGVANGVPGIPGELSCRQYGVIASASGTTQAIVNNAVGQGVAVTAGALTRVDFTGGNPGVGYSSPPAVIVANPDPIPAVPIVNLNMFAQPSGLVTSVSIPITPLVNGPYTSVPLGRITGGICVDTDVAPRCTGNTIPFTDAAGIARSGRQCISDDFNAGTK